MRRSRHRGKSVNALLLTPEGRRDWPLRFCSKERLFSKEARLGWVEPDLNLLPVPVPNWTGPEWPPPL